MFSPATERELKKRFEEEVIQPFKVYQQKMVAIGRKVYPKVTPIQVFIFFGLASLALNLAISAPIEKRLERAAERIIRKKKRRRA